LFYKLYWYKIKYEYSNSIGDESAK